MSPGNTVLVTGAARRVGAEIARTLARQGWRVILHYRTSEPEVLALCRDIRADGGVCAPIRADLADPAQAGTLIGRCVAAHGALSALVNNASRFEFDDIETMTPESLDLHSRTNLLAPLLLTRDFVRQLPEGGEGGDACVINLLDQKIVNLNPDYFSYTLGRLALAGATTMLAMHYAGRVRVNAIAPGLTVRSATQSEGSFAAGWRAPPLGRSSTAEDIANCAAFVLATPGLNGQILYLDGGERLLGRRRDVAFAFEGAAEG